MLIITRVSQMIKYSVNLDNIFYFDIALSIEIRQISIFEYIYTYCIQLSYKSSFFSGICRCLILWVFHIISLFIKYLIWSNFLTSIDFEITLLQTFLTSNGIHFDFYFKNFIYFNYIKFGFKWPKSELQFKKLFKILFQINL